MKLKLKTILLFLFFILIFSNLSFATEPEVASSAALLVESNTGKILYDKNSSEKMYPASTTKIMTAILTLENCDLTETATVSHNAIYSLPNGYVNANLQEGEEMQLKDLMYALMVKSANDAAIVIAEHIAGSVEEFADMMNAKAEELGCTNTHFVNPNGIHNENHYSTAHDLYLIASYCMQNETFRQYVSTPNYTLPATNKYPNADRICITTNDLIRAKSKYYNKEVIGIKTGYTEEAKNCLISAAQRDGIELFCVVLHAGTNAQGLSERYVDTNALFNYGFEDFSFKDIVKQDDIIENIDVENGSKDTKNLDLKSKENISVYIKNDVDIDSIPHEVNLNDVIEAPISENEVLGTVTYTIDDKKYTTELLATHSVEKKFDVRIIILAVGVLILLFGIILLISTSIKHKKRTKRRK